MHQLIGIPSSALLFDNIQAGGASAMREDFITNDSVRLLVINGWSY